jgi:nitrite reductase (NADH) small subunit
MAEVQAEIRTTRRVTVASLEEVPPGSVRIVSVDDRSIGIFNVGGELYALANRCPHAGSPVCRGSVGGMSEADRPGVEVHWGREGEILRCPWHGWEFDIASGRTVTEPVKRIPTYPVFVEDGRIVLELKRPPRRSDADR